MTFVSCVIGESVVVKCCWHSWDLSDAVVPDYFDADDDIEKDWTTVVATGPLPLEPLFKQLAESLDKWCFEAINNDSDVLQTSNLGVKLNFLLSLAHQSNNWAEAIPGILDFIEKHHADHLRFVIH